MNDKEWIFGFHAVEASLKSRSLQQVFIAKERYDKRMRSLLEEVAKASLPIHERTIKWLDEKAQEIKRQGGIKHQGIMAEVSVKKPLNEIQFFSLLEKITTPPFLLILDEVQDPHNVGACLRTAEAFGIDAVIVPKDNSCGLTPIVRQVSSGSSERIPFIEVVNLARFLEKLKARGIWLYGLKGGTATSLYTTDFSGPIAVVMGSEGKGLRRLTEKQCDFLLTIPMKGEIESLNVSVATAVTLSEIYRQKNL